jgi:hypothetical protein
MKIKLYGLWGYTDKDKHYTIRSNNPQTVQRMFMILDGIWHGTNGYATDGGIILDPVMEFQQST